MINPSQIDWEKVSGLVPAVVQDASSGQVLMLGYMNQEALAATLLNGKVTFFSRTKGRLWEKGETSGNYLKVKSITLDCDNDTLLILAKAKGPTCHKGTNSCFGSIESSSIGFLSELTQIIESRFKEKPEGSYLTRLIASGLDRIIQKVGEEGVETVIAAKNSDIDDFKGESADLLFHLMVLLEAKGLKLADICDVLKERHTRAAK